MPRKSRTPKVHERRRSRDEIDRNYFFGDVLIKTGVAVAFALGAIELYSPFPFTHALERHDLSYFGVLCAFALTGVASFLTGHHLRRVATHWDFD